MRYFKLIYDYENDDNYINCDIANIGDMNEYITTNGKIIDNWDNIVLEYNSSEGYVLTDYLANLYRWLVVSFNFQQLTKNIIENQVQYLPVKVIDRLTKAENNSYSVANILTIADALDMENSKYDIFELDGEKIISVEKYVLKSEQIKNLHIFRLKDDSIPIFISETLKKVIEDKKLIGFKFLEADVI